MINIIVKSCNQVNLYVKIKYILADFTPSGVLPPGDYALTFAELRQSLLVLGHAGNPHWDLNWRLELVNGCEILVRQLWAVGISAIFLDGSFVEDKAHPRDIDGYFECDLQTLSRVSDPAQPA